MSLGEGHHPDQHLLQACSPWTSETVNRGQGRKTALMSPDPSSDELSPNGTSLLGVCAGQYVWNQLYKGVLSPSSLCIQLGSAQLLGQRELGTTAGAAALMRSTPLLLGFGWGCTAHSPTAVLPSLRLSASLLVLWC